MKIIILIVFTFFSIHLIAQTNDIQLGQKVPAFTINVDSGKTININQLKGKIVFINFFATWCVPCMAELPILQRNVWDKYNKNPNFKMLVIGRGHIEKEVQNFKAKYNFTLPMYPDETKKIYSLFATKYIPRNYIIDKSGVVVYTSIAYDKEEFAKMLVLLETLLK